MSHISYTQVIHITDPLDNLARGALNVTDN